MTPLRAVQKPVRLHRKIRDIVQGHSQVHRGVVGYLLGIRLGAQKERSVADQVGNWPNSGDARQCTVDGRTGSALVAEVRSRHSSAARLPVNGRLHR